MHLEASLKLNCFNKQITLGNHSNHSFAITSKFEIQMAESAAKKPRIAQKTRDEILKERNARKKLGSLPAAKNASDFDSQYEWFCKNYKMKPLADVARCRTHWEAQIHRRSQRTMLHEDETATPGYNNLQNGNTRALPLTDEEQQRAKESASAKTSATLIAQNRGQMHSLESAGMLALSDILRSFGCAVSFERMLDCMIVDFCATIGSSVAPIQAKVTQALPGTQVNFHVNRADGSSGGRYEDHILIGIIVATEAGSEQDAKKFDNLPSTRVLEVYIMKSSDVTTCFCPYVFDHTTGSKRGRANFYEKFRYIVGRDRPETLQRLIQNLESYIHEIHVKHKWTRDDCFFKFGARSPNTNVSITQQTEIRGIQAVYDALSPFEARAPLRPNEATDIIFWHDGRKIRVSQKTASYHHLNKETAAYSGFYFHRSKAPNAHHCDAVIAVQFDVPDGKKVIAAYVFDAASVYATGRSSFRWNKSAHADKKFELTDNVGCEQFKDCVASFMKTDDERN